MFGIMRKGSIQNVWGEIVGRYWWREGMGRFSINWNGCRLDGYTDEGLIAWADKLEFYLVED